MSETKLIARRFSYVAAASAFAVLLTASGCGGGSTTITPPPTQVTPKGTYTLTVSATANNLPAQTISLTLTVN